MSTRLALVIGVVLATLAGGCAANDSSDGGVDIVEAAVGDLADGDPAPIAASVVPTTERLVPSIAIPAPTPIDLSSRQVMTTDAPVDDAEATPDADTDAGVGTPPQPETTVAVVPTEPEATSVVQPPEPAASATVAPPALTEPTGTDRVIEVANGAEVYSINCARCHSENGLGTFQASGLIGIGARTSNQSLADELTTGHPFTFGFADELSTEEIASVVAYVRATF